MRADLKLNINRQMTELLHQVYKKYVSLHPFSYSRYLYMKCFCFSPVHEGGHCLCFIIGLDGLTET